MLEVEDRGTKTEVQGGGVRVGSLGGITLFGFDLFTHNNADFDVAPLDVPSSKKFPIPKPLKWPRRRRGKGGGEEGDEEAGVVGDGEELEVFLGSGGLALLKRPSGAGGGTTATFSSGSHSLFRSQSQQSREGLGHFVSAPPITEQDNEEADLDGGLYAQTRKSTDSVTFSISSYLRRSNICGVRRSSNLPLAALFSKPCVSTGCSYA